MVFPADIPTRVNGQDIDASWFNILRDAVGTSGGSTVVDALDVSGATSGNVTGFTMDSALYSFYDISYYLFYTAGGTDAVLSRGQLICVYDNIAAAWVIMSDDRDLFDNTGTGENSVYTDDIFTVTTTAGVGQLEYQNIPSGGTTNIMTVIGVGR